MMKYKLSTFVFLSPAKLYYEKEKNKKSQEEEEKEEEEEQKENMFLLSA